MKCSYDKKHDILYIRLSDQDISESKEDQAGVIIDYDSKGNVVGVEILNASSRTNNPQAMELELL